ncbi:MAG: sulfatase [Deltaproteobacteria bacterium]|nr:sulfatase [Deltaproteobacteria bacterium]
MGRSARMGCLAALLATLAGCGEPVGPTVVLDSARDTGPPSILLVTIDTLRADHVSAYGYERETTPHLDALAAGGARFETAYSVSSTTLPSHATLFTSRYPDEHGVTKNGVALPADVPTLAERLSAAGWETAAFVSSFVVERRFGLARGFEHYDDDFAGADHSSALRSWQGYELDAPYDRRGAETTDRTLAWLAARKDDRPFFLWVHYFDPHSPYDPPAPHRGAFLETEDRTSPRHAIDLYDGDIHYADAELGRLLEATAAHAPLTLVTSDHGEGLWDHGWLEHGVFLYEEMVRVPWVVHWPRAIPAGRSIPGLAAHVDLAPTLAGLLGQPLLADPRGRDHSAALRGGSAAAPDRAVHLQRRHFDPMRRGHLRVAGSKHAVREGDWKLILSPGEQGFELYDLSRDPGEQDNLAGLRPDVVERLNQRLDGWQRSQRVHTAAPAAPDEDAQQRLRALGYVD